MCIYFDISIQQEIREHTSIENKLVGGEISKQQFRHVGISLL